MDEIYKPSGSTTLAEQTYEQQIRLLLQAPPFSGKTFAAMTFPNPVVLDFDQKLGAHAGRNDILQVPFWDGAYVDKIVKRDGLKCPPNKKDALLVWLNTEAPKLHKNQTLVIDGSTAVEAAFHMQYNLNPVLTRGGEIDGFAEWRQKDTYFGELAMALKSVSAHVIYICHEAPERDKKGELTGAVKPLMTGQFGDKLASHFTDCFRVLPFNKPQNEEQIKKCKEFFKLDEATYKEWMASGTPTTFWTFQTQSDEMAKCGSSTLVSAPKYILANYSSFSKYKRQTKQTS
jgi:hypothetical protein